jgi:hypothetical protein
VKLETITATEHRTSDAWYVMYPLDAYAMGPYRFEEPVTADVVVGRAQEQFGERPCSLWPDGPTEEVNEYEYELDVPGE